MLYTVFLVSRVRPLVESFKDQKLRQTIMHLFREIDFNNYTM